MIADQPGRRIRTRWNAPRSLVVRLSVLSILSRSAVGAGGVLVAALTAAGESDPICGPAVSAPDEPFQRGGCEILIRPPRQQQGLVGSRTQWRADELVVRGACRSLSGSITWKVFDNFTEAETAEDIKILDQGDIRRRPDTRSQGESRS